jgi:hypothetical protein
MSQLKKESTNDTGFQRQRHARSARPTSMTGNSSKTAAASDAPPLQHPRRLTVSDVGAHCGKWPQGQVFNREDSGVTGRSPCIVRRLTGEAGDCDAGKMTGGRDRRNHLSLAVIARSALRFFVEGLACLPRFFQGLTATSRAAGCPICPVPCRDWPSRDAAGASGSTGPRVVRPVLSVSSG